MITTNIFIGTILWSVSVSGCGISTHTEIGYRAIEYFARDSNDNTDFIRNILMKHQDAFQAGNPYPDSFYNSLCYDGQYHENSEDTHWGHYLKVAFEYVNTNYPQPWDEDTEKLVAFLFGIISHQVSDINWHNMEGLQDGYLRVLANIAFHGDFGTAHNYGDVADDMIGVFEWNVTSYAYEWYVPVHDLMMIYNDYYGTDDNVMTEEIVNTCSGMLLIGRLGEQIIGRSLYYYYAKKSPVMLDMLRDYYLGGLDDMATWTSLVWRQAARALINGTDHCDIPHNTLALNCDESVRAMDWVVDQMKTNLAHNPGEKAYNDLFLPSLEDVEITPEGRGVRIKIKADSIQKALENTENNDRNGPKLKEDPSDLKAKFIISTRHGYGTLGKALELVDLDNDGSTDLVTSTPGVNSECLFILFDVQNNLEEGEGVVNMIEDLADISICHRDSLSRFGTSLAIFDLNNDGVLDVAVGHPYSGVQQLQYHGGVTIHLGEVRDDGAYVVTNDTIAVSCSDKACGLGSVMVEHEGNLYLGAPNAGAGGNQRGGVVVINETILAERTKINIPDDVGWSYTGVQDYEHFGSSIAVTEKAIVVGSPTFRVTSSKDQPKYSQDDLQAAGKVTIFKENEGFEMAGRHSFDGLGSSLTTVSAKIDGVSRNLVAIGQQSSDSFSGNYTQTGSVVFLDLDNMDSQPDFFMSISGNMEVGRFGMRLDQSWDGGILISAPYAGLGLENYGKVYHFGDFSEGDVTSQCQSEWDPCTDEKSSLTLTMHEPESLFGSQISWRKADDGKVLLAVAAERSGQGARFAGSIYIYEIPTSSSHPPAKQ